MTSIEMVKYLNDERKFNPDAYAHIEHSDFLKRVPKVLGEGAGNFSSSYKSAQNKTLPCYTFPKREACLSFTLKIRGPTSSIPSRRSPRGPLDCPRMIEGGA